MAGSVPAGDGNRDRNGIWFHCFGWSVVDPCRPVGKALIDNRFLFKMSWTTQYLPLSISSLTTTDTGTSTSGGGDNCSRDINSGRSISARRADILSARGGGGGRTTATKAKTEELV